MWRYGIYVGGKEICGGMGGMWKVWEICGGKGDMWKAWEINGRYVGSMWEVWEICERYVLYR